MRVKILSVYILNNICKKQARNSSGGLLQIFTPMVLKTNADHERSTELQDSCVSSADLVKMTAHEDIYSDYSF